MSSDPFEQFERSKAGFAIPVVVFLIGALLTWSAMKALDPYVLTDDEIAAIRAELQAENDNQFLDEIDELESKLRDADFDLPGESDQNNESNPTPDA